MKRLAIVVSILLAAVTLLGTDGAARAAESPGELFQRGATAFEQGYYAVAATSFGEYIAAYPSRRQAGQAALLLAESNAYQALYANATEALDWIDQSRWADALETDVAYWRAQIALRTGQRQEALDAFNDFLKDNPKHELATYARLGIAQIRLDEGRYSEAVAAFDAVINAPADPEQPGRDEAVFLAALGKGRCLLRSGKIEDASKLVLGAMEKLKARPSVLGEAFVVLGEATYRSGKYDEALTYYRKSFVTDQLYWWYPEALYGIAWCQIELKQYDQAHKVLAELATDYPGDAVAPRAALSAAKLDMLEGHHGKAIDALRELAAKADGEPAATLAVEAEYLLGDALLSADKTAEAAAQYTAFLKAHPDSAFVPNVTYGLAMAKLRTGDTAEAIGLLEQVAAGGSVVAADTVAAAGTMAAAAAGTVAAASTVVAASTVAAAGTVAAGGAGPSALAVQAHRRLTSELFAAGKYKAAADHYRILLKLRPAPNDADSLLFGLAWCYYKAGDYDGSIALFGQLIEQYPQSEFADNAFYRIGGALFRQGKFDKALEAYKTLTDRFPTSDLGDRVAYQTAVCRYSLGDYYLALLAYKTVVDTYPQSPLVYRAAYEIGWCHYMLGKGQDAFEHFEDYTTRYPDSPLTPEVVFWLGEHHYGRGEYDRARERFADICTKYPTHELAAAAQYWAGRSCLNLGKYAEAREYFGKVVAEHAESDFGADAQYQTAVSYVEEGAYAKALELLEPLAAQEGARYLAEKVTWRTADCTLALGDVAKAQPLYESLVSEARDESVRQWARFGLGRCHQAKQEYDLAITEFMAIAWQPHVEPELKGRAKLAAGECYEARGEVNTALRIYASIVRDGLPGKDEAEQRRRALEKGTSRHFDNETGGDAGSSDGRTQTR